jgi:DNA-binding XRE family transcriptional regulator
MKTAEKKHTFKGFTSHEENVRKLKRTNPTAFKSLKNPDPKTCLAWNLIEIRNKKHMTQKELSDKSGIALRTVTYIENLDYGYNASLDVIQKIAKALGVGFRDLLQDVDLTEN